MLAQAIDTVTAKAIIIISQFERESKLCMGGIPSSPGELCETLT